MDPYEFQPSPVKATSIYSPTNEINSPNNKEHLDEVSQLESIQAVLDSDRLESIQAVTDLDRLETIQAVLDSEDLKYEIKTATSGKQGDCFFLAVKDQFFGSDRLNLCPEKSFFVKRPKYFREFISDKLSEMRTNNEFKDEIKRQFQCSKFLEDQHKKEKWDLESNWKEYLDGIRTGFLWADSPVIFATSVWLDIKFTFIMLTKIGDLMKYVSTFTSGFGHGNILYLANIDDQHFESLHPISEDEIEDYIFDPTPVDDDSNNLDLFVDSKISHHSLPNEIVPGDISYNNEITGIEDDNDPPFVPIDSELEDDDQDLNVACGMEMVDSYECAPNEHPSIEVEKDTISNPTSNTTLQEEVDQESFLETTSDLNENNYTWEQNVTPKRKRCKKRTGPHQYGIDYAMKEGCKDDCVHKCQFNFSMESRRKIHDDFYKLDSKSRQAWILSYVHYPPRNNESGKSRFVYNLPTESGNVFSGLQVCQKTFYNTLGYETNSGKFIRNAHKNLHNTPPPKVKEDTPLVKSIKEHIESYEPQVSHWRRKSCPNVRYLPPELTIKSMYENFNSDRTEKISYSTYEKTFKKMKISLKRTYNEECTTCLIYKRDHKPCPNNGVDCQECKEQMYHVKRYTAARINFEKCRKEAQESNDTMVYACDMQKVIMLPIQPTLKENHTTPRLSVFNETFAYVGGATPDHKHITVLWHYGISSRRASDVTSAYWTFMESINRKGNLVLWLDNCSGQNKNWTLILHLCKAIEYFDFETITLRFFVTGHTFMTPDAIHGTIENKIKKVVNVLDFPDFIKLVENCANDTSKKKSEIANPTAKKIEAVIMDDDKLINFPRPKTDKKKNRPEILNFSIVQFRKGSKNFFYSYFINTDDDDLIESEYLRDQVLEGDLDYIGNNSQVVASRKNGIVSKLMPHMESHQKIFWKSLKTVEDRNSSPSVIHNEDYEDSDSDSDTDSDPEIVFKKNC